MMGPRGDGAPGPDGTDVEVTAMPKSKDAHWAWLEANAHREEVQREIQEEIRRRSIRVVPTPDGGLQILPGEAAGWDGVLRLEQERIPSRVRMEQQVVKRDAMA